MNTNTITGAARGFRVALAAMVGAVGLAVAAPANETVVVHALKASGSG